MLYGMGGKLLYALTRVALPPLALAHVGLAEYGLWAATFVLVSYLGMAASGVGLVVLRGVARHHAAGDLPAIGRLLSTALLALGGLAAVLFVGLWLALPALLRLFQVSPEHQALARLLWLGAGGVFLADLALGLFGQVLHALGRVRQEQQVWMLAFLAESALIVGFLAAGLGVAGLLAAFVLRYLGAAAANAWLAVRALPGLALHWRFFDATLLRDLAGLGAGMQLAGLWATALHSADRVLAGALIGPHATALVDLAGKLPTTAGSLSSSVSAVAVSSAARHDVQGRSAGVQAVYRAASRLTVASLGLALPFLAAFAAPVATAWLGAGPARDGVALLMPALVLALHAHLLTGPLTAVQRGQGRLGADLGYAAWRSVALVGALALWWLQAGPAMAPAGMVAAPVALQEPGAPASPAHDAALAALVTWLAAGQALAALGWAAWLHLRLCGDWRGGMLRLLAPSLAAHALAQALAWCLLQAGATAGAMAAAGHTRPSALLALASAALLWLPLACALLGPWLLERQEAVAIGRRLIQPFAAWRRA